MKGKKGDNVVSNNEVKYGKLLVSASLIIVLILVVNITGFSDLSGDWENDLYFSPGSNVLGSFSSELYLNYYSGGIDYTSSSLFKKDSYYAQTFGAATSLGMVGVDSTLDFDPQEVRLNYFLAEADLTLADLNIGNTFLLEYTGDGSGFGSGYELELYGELPGGPKMYVTNLFGMEENEAEALEIVRGSGYTIKTGSSQAGSYGPSQLQYVSTTIEISELSLDCCNFMATTKFSEESGFEHSILEFDLESETLPLKLDGKLKFTSQAKSIELDPKLDLDWACFDVYTDLSTPDDENLLTNSSSKTSTIGGLEIEGFGITGVKLGHVTFSSLTALEGNLNRLTDQENMDLRAYDYVLDPDPVYSGLYTNTPYDEVISIEKSNRGDDLYFGADVYFDMSGSDSLFDTALFTGAGNYDLSDQFTMGAGAAIKPGELKNFRLSFDYSF